MSFKFFTLSVLASAGAVRADGAGTLLDPVRPILTPDGAMAQNPLGHVGANGPWQPGPNVFGISPEIPSNCKVDQAAYISRHGSRYPDSGAHNGWVAMADLFKTKNYNATGPLAFIHDWDTPLERPDIQIAQESKTGYKELFDLGYTLRIRYPDLYNEGDPFYVWANNYTRVIQTAQLFTHGFLGANASLGTVVSVTGAGIPSALGNTLAPSDMCPTFVDDSSKQQTAWSNVWMPAFIERLSNGTPFICGFESQILGRLSPFCDTFTQEELEQYEYQQDLRYYYGVGPGADVASKMMVPFLDSLMKHLVGGPDVEGTDFNGGKFKVPNLLMSFLNDGQLNELVAASGIFDEQDPLPTDRIAEDRLFRSSRISPMRGTIAFERMTCSFKKPANPKPGCKPRPTTYVRVRLNDAVYPIPSCQDGPGKTCSLSKYAKMISSKNKAQGSFAKLCNVTSSEAPNPVKGASFFTDLAQPQLRPVKP
ncbi:histidine phosphatase superfamily (branch 2) domain-containing protein [Sarocladium implicatum]|nr:histidine phosphatase superfamily (branch 2) domain-containing protein [Sarocladium implicatum]